MIQLESYNREDGSFDVRRKPNILTIKGLFQFNLTDDFYFEVIPHNNFNRCYSPLEDKTVDRTADVKLTTKLLSGSNYILVNAVMLLGIYDCGLDGEEILEIYTISSSDVHGNITNFLSKEGIQIIRDDSITNLDFSSYELEYNKTHKTLTIRFFDLKR